MRVLAAVVATFAVVSLAACAGPSSVADNSYRGVPETLKSLPPSSGSPVPVWMERGKSFSITRWGSSSCAPVPTKIESSGSEVTIRFEDAGKKDCTADMAATTHEFTVPDGTGPPPLKITLTYSSWDGQNILTLS